MEGIKDQKETGIADREETGRDALDFFKRYPNIEKILNLELPVIVVLAEKAMSVEDVLALNEGSVIVFKKHNSESLDILINNRKIGAGKTIKIGERFGVHIREIGTPQEIVEKLRWMG